MGVGSRGVTSMLHADFPKLQTNIIAQFHSVKQDSSTAGVASRTNCHIIQ